jgi:hypothetical protein
MADLMEVIKGISQVMAQTYDGARDEKGEPIKVGLRRESVPPLTSCECRLLDGFKARVTHYSDKNESFPCLIMSYQSEIKLEEAHNPKLMQDVEELITEALKYLKKEFKKVTGKELSVQKHGDAKMLVEELSKIRVNLTAQCHYKIGGVDMPKLENPSDTQRAKKFQDWLSLGGFKK